MKLSVLLDGIAAEVYGKTSQLKVNGISDDSRVIGPGYIFIAKMGRNYNGNDYILNSVRNGAIAVVSDCYNPLINVIQIVSNDINCLETELAKRFYEDSSKKLYTIAVTGTNGKTTISYMLRHILSLHGLKTGMLGTIEYDLGDNVLEADLTTPSKLKVHQYLRDMRRNSCDAAVMEATSIGIKQGRIDGIDFNACIFTNLTVDHLDIHESIENYANAKELLFSKMPCDGIAVVNSDSPWSETMVRRCKANIIRYGMNVGDNILIKDLELFLNKSRVCFECHGVDYNVNLGLVGKFNVYNAIASIAVCVFGLGMKPESVIGYIESFYAPKGRLEPVDGWCCNVFIDYAHTPDALENILSYLNELIDPAGKIITVFGCGGDRDRAKRPMMAAIVEKYGLAIVTSDNPRSEEPMDIISDIEKGFSLGNYIVESDRRLAIRKAMEIASEKDIVVIAGKGHEKYQKFKNRTIFFDDSYEVSKMITEYSVIM